MLGFPWILSRLLFYVTRLDLWRCPARIKLEVEGRETCESEPQASEGNGRSLPPLMRRQFFVIGRLDAASFGRHQSSAGGCRRTQRPITARRCRAPPRGYALFRC